MANYNLRTEWRKGAFQGLLNAKNWLESHSEYLREHRIPVGQIPKIISVMIENLDAFMETGDTFPIKAAKTGNGRKRVWKFTKGTEGKD